jgi:hypothetical protein
MAEEPLHPNAPRQADEGPLPVDNSDTAVRARAGVEVGAMRYVLWIGLALAILLMVAAYFLGYLPAA